jgi:hypothetical protein
MDTTYGRAVALAVPVFVSAIALEFVIDRVRGARYYHLADAINSLSCGTPLFSIFRLKAGAPGSLPLCFTISVTTGSTASATHSVHHQSEEFNLTTALRQPGTGAFTNWIFYLPMALCGIPIGVFLLTGVIQLFYQFWPHTRLIGRLGILGPLDPDALQSPRASCAE